MRIGLFRLAALFAVSVSLALPAGAASLRHRVEIRSSQLNFAGAQAEIIAVLLAEQQYSSILLEFQKIANLGLVGEDETLLVRHAWYVALQLGEAGQFSLAHRIVEETLAKTTADLQNRYRLLMLKGKLFKEQRLFEQAIEVYRQAQQLAVPVE